ncbi:MAG: hypothetical protein P9L96_03560 [Candidatus Gygaella obscura]|nr:hypothetical protein [Candidatus Gygaella obscura]
MFKAINRKQGFALMVVLAFTIIIVIMAGTVLAILTSQGRLSEHQFRRTLAYYSANAGIQYGLEMLRLGTTQLGAINCSCCDNPNVECDLTPSLNITQNNQDFTINVHIGTETTAGDDFDGTRPVSASVQYSTP